MNTNGTARHMEQISHHPHDHLFRTMMRKESVYLPFFARYLPPHIQRMIESKETTLTESTYVDEKLKETSSDLVFKTKFLDAPGYLYILIEQQSVPDPDMAFRLLRYTVEIMTQHRDGHPKAPYPLVYPLVEA